MWFNACKCGLMLVEVVGLISTEEDLNYIVLLFLFVFKSPFPQLNFREQDCLEMS